MPGSHAMIQRGEKSRLVSTAVTPGYSSTPSPSGPSGPQPVAADAGGREGSDPAAGAAEPGRCPLGDAGTFSPFSLLTPSPTEPEVIFGGQGWSPQTWRWDPQGLRQHQESAAPKGPGVSSALGKVQGKVKALLSAACWGTGTNWVLPGCGDWEIPCLHCAGGWDACVLPLWGSQIGFLFSVAYGVPRKGWHPPTFPIFMSCDANTTGKTPSPPHQTDPCVVPSSTHPFYRRGN